MGSQLFDTGLGSAQRTLIRRALVAHLGTAPTGRGTPLLASAGGYLAAIGELPRPLRDGSEEELGLLGQALQGAVSPALAVALGDQEFGPVGMGGTTYSGELELAIYAVSSNMLSFVAGRLEPDALADTDPTADPGIDTMLEHVRQLLCGTDLAIPTVRQLRPRSEREVATDPGFSIWELRFVLGVDIAIDPQRAVSPVERELDVFETPEAHP